MLFSDGSYQFLVMLAFLFQMTVHAANEQKVTIRVIHFCFFLCKLRSFLIDGSDD
jgi:hypothetical protein